MKTSIIVLISLVLSVSAFAQSGKKMTLPPTIVPASSSSASSYNTYQSVQNEITANMGLTAGAFNMGVDYIRPTTDFGFGGYFFMQSSKTKNSVPVVSQITAFGGMIKVNLVETAKIRAYMAPGVGIAMIKDASTSATGSKSDENIISPSFKMGVQMKVAPRFIIGLERMQFSNWLNDSLNSYVGPSEYYTVAGTFQF